MPLRRRGHEKYPGDSMSGPFVAIGEVLRYVEKAKLDPTVETIDGLRNFHRLTALQSSKAVLLERGISGIAAVRTSGVDRRPAVLIRSSPHKRGREETPWEDAFDVDVGHIRYFGDNKPRELESGWSVRTAAEAPGNKLLSELATLHQSPDQADRRRAAPLLFFRSVASAGAHEGAAGVPRFRGHRHDRDGHPVPPSEWPILLELGVRFRRIPA